MTVKGTTTAAEAGGSDLEVVAGLPALRLILRDARGSPRLTPELIDRLARSLEAESEARLVLLEGGERAFCEGLDLEALSPGLSSGELLARFAALLTALASAPRPVVALVDGPALGGGVGLAAVADLVLASPRATFALPETLMGLLPAVVFPFLVRRMGVSPARLLALGSAPLTPERAFQLGLVDEIVDDFGPALARHARRFVWVDGRALGMLKALVSSYFAAPAGYFDAAAARFSELLATEETQARLLRFAAGETPWPGGEEE